MARIGKLGLAPGRKEDLRTLQLRDFLRRDFAYPAVCDLTTGFVRDRDPLGNIDAGDCAIAGPGHFVRWEDQVCGRPTRVRTVNVIDEYQEHWGYVPSDPSTDNGAYFLDVCKVWRNSGLFGTQIEAFASVDWRNREEVAKATFLLGGVFYSFSLPNRVQGKDVWDEDGTDDGGHWGNHLVWSFGTNLVCSWGDDIWVSDAFRERRCYGAIAVVSADAIKPDGRAFSGLDLAGLREALAEVTG